MPSQGRLKINQILNEGVMPYYLISLSKFESSKRKYKREFFPTIRWKRFLKVILIMARFITVAAVPHLDFALSSNILASRYKGKFDWGSDLGGRE